MVPYRAQTAQCVGSARPEPTAGVDSLRAKVARADGTRILPGSLNVWPAHRVDSNAILGKTRLAKNAPLAATKTGRGCHSAIRVSPASTAQRQSTTLLNVLTVPEDGRRTAKSDSHSVLYVKKGGSPTSRASPRARCARRGNSRRKSKQAHAKVVAKVTTSPKVPTI